MKHQYFCFKGVRFPYNPKSVTIKRERRLVRFLSPLAGNIIQDLGSVPMVVSGVGELDGAQAVEQLNTITGLFEEGGTGLLQLPGYPPIRAWFSSFQSEEAAGMPLVRYRFSFVEEPAQN